MVIESNDPQVLAAESSDIARFLATLFAPDEVVCLRFIEVWTEDGVKESQVKSRRYPRAKQVAQADYWTYLHDQAEAGRANEFFGVCPRVGRYHFDLACQIRTVRCLWADLDYCTPEDAVHRCEAAGLPRPTIIVASGNGVHLYWLLREPFLIDDAGEAFPIYKDYQEYRTTKGEVKHRTVYYLDEDKTQQVDPKRLLSAKARFVQAIQQGMARRLGGDHTQDLARILRLPGTLNRKDIRNGKTPVPCILVEMDANRRYTIQDFERFQESAAVPLTGGKDQPTEVTATTINSLDHLEPDQRVTFKELLAECAHSTLPDRSSRDYRLVKHAVECDLDAEMVWPLVESISKFQDRGRDYFDNTWKRAWAVVQQDRAFPLLEAKTLEIIKAVEVPQKPPAKAEADAFDAKMNEWANQAKKAIIFETWDQTCTIAAGQKEDWLVPHWAEFGCLHLLTGLPFSGKSSIVAEIVASMATGKPFCGMAVQQVPLVLLDLENRERIIVKRIKNALGGDQGILSRLWHRVNPVHIPRPLSNAFIRTCIDALKSTMKADKGLVVIDTMRSAFAGSGKKENDNDDMAAILYPLQTLAQVTGWAILVLHHNTKGANHYAGGTVIAGAADYLWNWTSDKAKLTGQLAMDGGRDDHQHPLEFRYDMDVQRNIFLGKSPERLAAEAKEKQDRTLAPWLSLLPTEPGQAVDREYLRTEALKAGLLDQDAQPKTQMKNVERRLQEALNLQYVAFVGGGGRGDPYRYYRTALGSSVLVHVQAQGD